MSRLENRDKRRRRIIVQDLFIFRKLRQSEDDREGHVQVRSDCIAHFAIAKNNTEN